MYAYRSWFVRRSVASALVGVLALIPVLLLPARDSVAYSRPPQDTLPQGAASPNAALSQRSHRSSPCDRRRHHRALRPPRAPRRHRCARDRADLRALAHRHVALRHRRWRDAREARRRRDRHLRQPRARQLRTHARRLLRRRPRHQRGDGARRLRLGVRQILDELRAARKRRRARCTSASGKARPSPRGSSARTAGPAPSRMPRTAAPSRAT